MHFWRKTAVAATIAAFLVGCKKMDVPLVRAELYFLDGRDFSTGDTALVFHGSYFNDGPRVIRDAAALAQLRDDELYFIDTNAGIEKREGLITKWIYTERSGYAPLVSVYGGADTIDEYECHVSECGRSRFLRIDQKPEQLRAAYQAAEPLEIVFASPERQTEYRGKSGWYYGGTTARDTNVETGTMIRDYILPSQLLDAEEYNYCWHDFPAMYLEFNEARIAHLFQDDPKFTLHDVNIRGHWIGDDNDLGCSGTKKAIYNLVLRIELQPDDETDLVSLLAADNPETMAYDDAMILQGIEGLAFFGQPADDATRTAILESARAAMGGKVRPDARHPIQHDYWYRTMDAAK